MPENNSNTTTKYGILKKVGTPLTVLYGLLYMAYGKNGTSFAYFLRAVPAVWLLLCGIFFVMESISPDNLFPSREWSVTEGGNNYIEIFGFRRYFGATHVVASGVMSMRTARTFYAFLGSVLAVGGTLWLLYQFEVLPLKDNPDIANASVQLHQLLTV